MPAGAFGITVCGNKFVNQAGQPVVLRGVNTEGTQYDCAQSGAGFFDDTTINGTDYSTEIAAMKAWGINVVRVNLNEECWLGINGVPATTSALGPNGYNAYANAMGSYVSALNAAGIYAEIDLHLNAPGGELIADPGKDDFQNPLPESNSDLFWKSVATYFVNNPAVIFGVFNEPFPPNSAVNGDTAAGWNCDVNGCQVPDYTSTSNYSQIPSSTYAGEGMAQMIDDIRSVNTTAPLLVGGPDWAGDLDQWLATFYPGGSSIDPDNKLAASVHIYFPGGNSPCSLSTNVTTACPTTAQGAQSNNGILQVAAVAPVEIDELGDFNCSASSLTPFLTSVDAADDSGTVDVGYVGWAWTTSSCDPTLITSYATGQPSAMGTAEYCRVVPARAQQRQHGDLPRGTGDQHDSDSDHVNDVNDDDDFNDYVNDHHHDHGTADRDDTDRDDTDREDRNPPTTRWLGQSSSKGIEESRVIRAERAPPRTCASG